MCKMSLSFLARQLASSGVNGPFPVIGGVGGNSLFSFSLWQKVIILPFLREDEKLSVSSG